jgi:hypothetical protein
MQSSQTTTGVELGAPHHEEGVRERASMKNSRPLPYDEEVYGSGLSFSEAKPRSETSLTDVANDVAQKRHAGSPARCMPQ